MKEYVVFEVLKRPKIGKNGYTVNVGERYFGVCDRTNNRIEMPKKNGKKRFLIVDEHCKIMDKKK